MKILVTGGAGYVGSRLVGHLLQNGFKVRVVDNLYFNNPEGLVPYATLKDFEFIYGDIANEDIVRDGLKGVDAVVHLAAIVSEKLCDIVPQKAQEVNVDATIKLVKASKSMKIPLIFASTCSNYGISTGVATEQSPTSPLSLYAKTKIEGEKQVLDHDGTVLRFATALGFAPRFRSNILVHEFIGEALSKKQISVYDGEGWRPFVHLADMADAVMKAIDRIQELKGQVINVVGENIQKNTLAAKVAKQFDARIVANNSDRDKRNYRVSGEKSQQLLKFSPRWSIEAGIEELKQMIDLRLLDPTNPRWNTVLSIVES